jgi:hypothetical protein
MEKARREEMRWLILFALREAQEIGLSEHLIRVVMTDVMPDATELETRRALDYLAERTLVSIEKKRAVWFAKINRHGIDIVEYTVPCDPGIARPRGW